MQAGLEQTSAQLQTSQSSLQTEQTRNARLAQACADIEVRLNDQLQQVQSLEEQQRHSRHALEHYRTSVREQREQELRRHEAQVQMIQVEVRQLQQSIIVYQDEQTRLNRANERLLAEAAQHQRQWVGQQQAQASRQEEWGRVREQLEGQAAQLRAELEGEAARLREQLIDQAQRAARAEGAQAMLREQLTALQARQSSAVDSHAEADPQG